MPNLIGMNLEEATDTLTSVGILHVPSWYQFEAWPVSVTWTRGIPSNLVTAQTPSSGSSVNVNAAIELTVNEFPLSTVYP